MKYIGTNFFPSTELRKAYEKLKGETDNQMRIIVKSRGRKDAERICQENGLAVTFEPNYSCETGNTIEIETCDKSLSGIAIGKTHTVNSTVTLEEIKG